MGQELGRRAPHPAGVLSGARAEPAEELVPRRLCRRGGRPFRRVLHAPAAGRHRVRLQRVDLPTPGRAGRGPGAQSTIRNEDGGSRWFCWNRGDVSPKHNTPSRDSGRRYTVWHGRVREPDRRAGDRDRQRPEHVPTIDGRIPCDTIDVVGGTVRVRVDFREARVALRDLAEPGDRQRTRVVPVNGSGERGRVSRVNIVVGRSDACPPGRDAANSPSVVAQSNLRIVRHEVTDREREQGIRGDHRGHTRHARARVPPHRDTLLTHRAERALPGRHRLRPRRLRQPVLPAPVRRRVPFRRRVPRTQQGRRDPG